MKLSEMGLIKRMKLKLITKLQKLLLGGSSSLAVNLYYYLAKKHFSIWFDGLKDLEKETLENTEDSYKAAKRHARLVVNTLYKDSQDLFKRMVRSASKGAFVKNIIVNTKL